MDHWPLNSILIGPSRKSTSRGGKADRPVITPALSECLLTNNFINCKNREDRKVFRIFHFVPHPRRTLIVTILKGNECDSPVHTGNTGILSPTFRRSLCCFDWCLRTHPVGRRSNGSRGLVVGCHGRVDVTGDRRRFAFGSARAAQSNRLVGQRQIAAHGLAQCRFNSSVYIASES